ncbi:PH domain-containing protein [Gemella sp. GH3]|uniref:PH domain-containing protein n=1 Tax=unclassified Gemella TaxID=2624949 RepID=UPI0015D0BAD3|nr:MULTISPECIES: PH domain-containing protein [unclassified Gemella]MBF0713996.1 PH domain-containing protein [Gemella sp. GH3.1]NYS50948.1 PH domain-containing protein [Gemella sp. GH3]
MFKITEYGITIKSGIFGDIKEFIPYNTIKSIEINNGPIMRKYNFSNIELNKINYSSTLKYINSDIVNDIKNKIVYNKDKYMNNMI